MLRTRLAQGLQAHQLVAQDVYRTGNVLAHQHLVPSPQGGRVSSGVAERTLSFIKALDSAWKTLEPCDRELLHHTQFMPMLFRWLRRHK